MGGDVMEEIPNRPGRHQEELVKFFEMSLDMLCIADFSGHFTRINAAWEATLGHTTAELCAVPYVDFIHPDDRASTLAEAAHLKVGVDTVLFENRYRCRDGSWRSCEATWANCESSSFERASSAAVALSVSSARFLSVMSRAMA